MKRLIFGRIIPIGSKILLFTLLFGIGLSSYPVLAQSESSEGEVVKKWEQTMPEFPGGHQALKSYLRKNVTHPKNIKRRHWLAGVVSCEFVVKPDGSIGNVIVKKSLSKEYDDLVTEAINAMPKWKPGIRNGKAVAFYYTLPITFGR